MGSLKAVLRRAVLVVLAATLLVGFCPMPANAAGPSKADVFSVLKKYDKDGYYIVKTMDKRGDDVMAYWNGSTLFDAFDTMVHEECHGYTHTGWYSDQIYVGGKKSVKVAFTDVFRSKKVAKSVPKKLRSDRFWTYVGKAEADLASNKYGAYGMLNEFAAYCWGFNDTVKLYAFAKRFKCTDAVWLDYVGSSDVAKAYVEFRYFIEHYLYYAKKHDSKVYKAILHNKQFVRAIKKVDKKFSSLVRTFDKRLPKIAKMLRKAGYKVELSGDSFFVSKGGNGNGRGLEISEYNRFASELGKSKYRKIEKKLGLKHVAKRKVSIGSGSGKLKSAGSISLMAAAF